MRVKILIFFVIWGALVASESEYCATSHPVHHAIAAVDIKARFWNLIFGSDDRIRCAQRIKKVVHQSPSESECVVFVCNKKYFKKFLATLEQLVTKGHYHGDVCLVIGNDLLGDNRLNHPLLRDNHVVVKYFPDLHFNEEFYQVACQMPRYDKIFQYHKLYLFHPYFKRWKTVLYMDCGMCICADIRPILDLKQENTLFAHSDAYPEYTRKLRQQFDAGFSPYYQELIANFHLDIDYFQTGVMLYDTNIVTEHTFDDLYQLALRFPNCRANDQGIIALYFTNVDPVWKQLPFRNEHTYFYDFMKRGRKDPFIMFKYQDKATCSFLRPFHWIIFILFAGVVCVIIFTKRWYTPS